MGVATGFFWAGADSDLTTTEGVGSEVNTNNSLGAMEAIHPKLSPEYVGKLVL